MPGNSERYIAFLRGVNVGGKTIKMDELKKLFESLGFIAVETFIQSGNVLFSAKSGSDGLKKLLEKEISSTFGFDVTTILKTMEEMKGIISGNPFLSAGERVTTGKDPAKMHVTFLDEMPVMTLAANLKTDKPTNDEYLVSGKVIYLYCPDGYGRTIYSNMYIERKLKIRATTRNWNTVTKLAAMLAQ